MSKRLRLRDILGGPRTDNGSRGAAQPRRIVLGGRAVDYDLFRARRRSIGMQISLSGLTVRAPR